MKKAKLKAAVKIAGAHPKPKNKKEITRRLLSLQKQIAKKQEDLKALRERREQLAKLCHHPKQFVADEPYVGMHCTLCDRKGPIHIR